MNNLVYVIIDTSDVPSVDFDAVLETSADTLRYSLDDTKTLVKFKRSGDSEDGEESAPSFLVGKPQYNHDEIRAVMATEAWTEPIDVLE